MDVVAEENQEECLGIQDQTSGEAQVSMNYEGRGKSLSFIS